MVKLQLLKGILSKFKKNQPGGDQQNRNQSLGLKFGINKSVTKSPLIGQTPHESFGSNIKTPQELQNTVKIR